MRWWLLLLLFVPVALPAQPKTVTFVPAQSYNERKQSALVLTKTDAPVAEQQLRKLIGERPDDPEVLVALGSLVSGRAGRLEIGAKRKMLLKEAREYYVRAQAAGSNEPLIGTVLAAVNADGSENRAVFSTDAKIDEAIHAGERAFEQRDFTKAIEWYQKALAIDPRNYAATVYIGDAYFASGDNVQAVSWFSKATILNPNRELAYRYAGDAQMRRGKKEDALEQYLQAVIAEPYSGYPNRALRAYCQANQLELGLPAPAIPRVKVVPDDKGNPQISLPENFTVMDFAYASARAKWQVEHPNPAGAKAPPYRQTLAEETNALRTMLTIWKELAASGNKPVEGGRPIGPELQASLEQLQEIETAGLLEAHVLLGRANQDLVADYAAYRDENRGKLHDYLARYYLHAK